MTATVHECRQALPVSLEGAAPSAQPAEPQRVVRSSDSLLVVATAPQRRGGSLLLFFEPARLLPVVLAASCLLSACDDESAGELDASMAGADSSPAPDSTPAAPDSAPAAPDMARSIVLGDIRVRVESSEGFDGTLRVGAFLHAPPDGPPLALERTVSPTFPVDLVLRGLEPNTYFVVAALDLDPPSPTLPGSEDPTEFSEAVVVRGDDVHDVVVSVR